MSCYMMANQSTAMNGPQFVIFRLKNYKFIQNYQKCANVRLKLSCIVLLLTFLLGCCWLLCIKIHSSIGLKIIECYTHSILLSFHADWPKRAWMSSISFFDSDHYAISRRIAIIIQLDCHLNDFFCQNTFHLHCNWINLPYIKKKFNLFCFIFALHCFLLIFSTVMLSKR